MVTDLRPILRTIETQVDLSEASVHDALVNAINLLANDLDYLDYEGSAGVLEAIGHLDTEFRKHAPQSDTRKVFEPVDAEAPQQLDEAALLTEPNELRVAMPEHKPEAPLPRDPPIQQPDESVSLEAKSDETITKPEYNPEKFLAARSPEERDEVERDYEWLFEDPLD